MTRLKITHTVKMRCPKNRERPKANAEEGDGRLNHPIHPLIGRTLVCGDLRDGSAIRPHIRPNFDKRLSVNHFLYTEHANLSPSRHHHASPQSHSRLCWRYTVKRVFSYAVHPVIGLCYTQCRYDANPAYQPQRICYRDHGRASRAPRQCHSCCFTRQQFAFTHT